MRTKSVKTQPNGTPDARATDDPPPSESKPPANPQELSDADRQQLRAYLDKNEKPFTILTIPPTNGKKRKRDSGLLTQGDLFDDRLTVQYEVRPSHNWENLRRYKKFTVGSESIATGECILVKHDDSEEARLNIPEQWKAKVLEVRALDPEHVYIRVAWLNRPEDLDSGRKPFHGRNELIPTNQLDVIDAMSVNGRLDIAHWDEHEDEKQLSFEDQFYWRQTYDFAKTKTLSSLRHICVDNQPQNPDELIIQCSKPDCRKWLHVKCIAEDAVLRASDESADGARSNGAKLSKKAKATSLSIPPGSKIQAKAARDAFTAEVYVSGLPSGADQEPSEKTEVIITDASGKRETKPVHCLFCKQEID